MIVNCLSVSPNNYFSYALLRSVLALSTLLNIIFNKNKLLFPKFVSDNQTTYSKVIISDLNISYFVFQNPNLFRFVSIIILILVIIGILPRITGLLHFFVSFVFYKTCLFIDGGDQLASNITFLLIPLTLIDKNKNHWNVTNYKNSRYLNIIWWLTTLLINIQIAILYLQSGIEKLSVNEWRDGTALWYWMMHEQFGVNDMLKPLVKLILSNNLVIFFINWTVIILEILIFNFLFVNKRTSISKSLFIVSILFHIGIIITHGIFTFSIIMIGALIFYFNAGEYIKDYFCKLKTEKC